MRENFCANRLKLCAECARHLNCHKLCNMPRTHVARSNQLQLPPHTCSLLPLPTLQIIHLINLQSAWKWQGDYLLILDYIAHPIYHSLPALDCVFALFICLLFSLSLCLVAATPCTRLWIYAPSDIVRSVLNNDAAPNAICQPDNKLLRIFAQLFIVSETTTKLPS